MGNILDINPGLIFWTLINFFVFIFLFSKLFLKPITNAIKKRGQSIQDNINQAAQQNEEAKLLLAQANEKIAAAQNEMSQIIARGKLQSEELIKQAAAEAESVKRKKIDDATREIDRKTENAIAEIRKEIASLAILVSEKIIGSELDKDKHKKLIDSYIDQIPKN